MIVSKFEPPIFRLTCTKCCLLAITTVGYGEITPRSFLGRLITLPLLVFGLLLIALPSFVLGREFSLVWEEMTEKEQYNHDHEHDAPDSPEISTSTRATRPAPQDLTNFKLAQNQLELSLQIEELKSTVEAQRVMMERLLDAIERRERDGDWWLMAEGAHMWHSVI